MGQKYEYCSVSNKLVLAYWWLRYGIFRIRLPRAEHSRQPGDRDATTTFRALRYQPRPCQLRFKELVGKGPGQDRELP